MMRSPVVSEYNGDRINDQPTPKGVHPVKSKVFSIDIINKPDFQQVWFYRTNGRSDGGGLRMYTLTVSRLIRLLRAMVNTSTKFQCNTYTGPRTSSWWVAGVVEKAYAAEAALQAS